MELNVVNNNQTNKPNVLHFQGDSLMTLKTYFEYICFNCNIGTCPDDLTIISMWTDDEKCALKHQCERFNVKLINAVPDDYNRSKSWNMVYKIGFITSALKNVNTKYTLILDGFDVLITDLDTILDKFIAQEFDILFNASANNYPNVLVDSIPWRSSLGDHRYLNAGCCIGKTDSLMKFYGEVDSLKEDNLNILRSEQYIVRKAFSKYSDDPQQKFVFIDYESKIFQTMISVDGGLLKDKDEEKYTISISNNDNFYSCVIIGSHSEIGSKFTYEISKLDYSINYFQFDKSINCDTRDAIGLLKRQRIDTVYYLVDYDDEWIGELINVCYQSGVEIVTNSNDERFRNYTYSVAICGNDVISELIGFITGN